MFPFTIKQFNTAVLKSKHIPVYLLKHFPSDNFFFFSHTKSIF